MKKTLLALALGTSAIAAGACSAQTTPSADAAQTMTRDQAPTQAPTQAMGRMGHGMLGAMMKRSDANKDGVITRAEAIAEADERFDTMDTNRDGTVTTAERTAMRQAMRDRMTAAGNTPPEARDGGSDWGRDGGRKMARGGPDGDGVLTRAEAEARAAKRFDRMDSNHDGKLDATELANMREMRHMRRGEMKQRGMTPGAVPPPADANAQ